MMFSRISGLSATTANALRSLKVKRRIFIVVGFHNKSTKTIAVLSSIKITYTLPLMFTPYPKLINSENKKYEKYF